MIGDIVTVFCNRFSVPGAVNETGIGTVKISYHPPGTHARNDWFHDLDAGGPRAGRRMGDYDETPVRYSKRSEAA